jgi:hypothetical protein
MVHCPKLGQTFKLLGSTFEVNLRQLWKEKHEAENSQIDVIERTDNMFISLPISDLN